MCARLSPHNPLRNRGTVFPEMDFMKTFSLSILTTTMLLLHGSVSTGQDMQLAAADFAPAYPGDGHDSVTNSYSAVHATGVGFQTTHWNGDCQSCRNGNGFSHGNNCQGSGCFNGPGLSYDPHSNCPLGMCAANNGCLTNSSLSSFFAGKAYPDAGWAPPARLPVNRDTVWYANYYPQAFYGNPGGGFIGNYPQVYQPNDTTQLGYTYQTVPTWQSRPGMIPPAPVPSHFHTRVCPNGIGYSGPPVGNFNPPVPQTAMQRPQIVRPQIAGKSGSRSLFRLSSLTSLLD